VAVPPIVPTPPVAVLVATRAAVVFVGTPVAVVPIFVVDVLVPPNTVVPLVAVPVTVVEADPPAPAAVVPRLLKNCRDGCRNAVVLRSGICARVKLGACKSRA
jgi:hypothetical protein